MNSSPPEKSAHYRTVKEVVLRRIRDGQYPAGSLLPIETELALEFSLARATVNRAMRELAEEGIIDRKRRAGSRVNAHPVRNARFAVPLVRVEIAEKGADYRYRLVKRATRAANAQLAARMAVDAKAQVLWITSIHYADDAPYLFEERWINLATIPEAATADFTATSANEWLVSRIPLSKLDMSFLAEGASARAAALLEVEPGTPVITAERQTWLDDQSITFARLTYHAGYRLISQ